MHPHWYDAPHRGRINATPSLRYRADTPSALIRPYDAMTSDVNAPLRNHIAHHL